MRHTRPWLMVLAITLGCGTDGPSVGLSGCDGDASFRFETTTENTISGGVHVTVTAAGTSFLLGYKELLAGLVFPVDDNGWVRLELEPFVAGGDRLGITLREVAVRFNLRETDIDIQFLANPTRIRLTVDNAQLRLEDGVVALAVGGDGACRLGNGIDVGQPTERFLTTDIVVDLFLTVDEESRLGVEVALDTANLGELDVELIFDPDLPECADGLTAAECRVGCSASNLGAELLELVTTTFGAQISQFLLPIVDASINELLAQLTEEPLAIEGRVHARDLADVIPLPLDAHPLEFKAGPARSGFTLRTAGNRGDGIGLTLDVGLDAIDHPCVPRVAGEPNFRVGEAPILTGFDHEGDPYQMGASIAEATLNRALWAGWRSGMFCMTLDSHQIEALVGQRIDTSTLGLLLPGLNALTDGPQPIMLAVDPRFSAAAFPLALLRSLEDEGGIPQVGLNVAMPTVSLDLYTVVQSRWTRIFRARVDLEIEATIQANPDNTLGLSLDTPRIHNLEQTYNELLDSDNVPELMELLVGVATSALAGDGLEFELGLEGMLESLTGLPLEAEIRGMRIDGLRSDFLSVLMGLRGVANGDALTAAVDTYAEVLEVAPGRAEISVGVVGADAALYQWRLDGGPWRPLGRADAGRVRVVDPFLRIPGPHTLRVRAVAVGRYRSLDPTPTALILEVPNRFGETGTGHRKEASAAASPIGPSCNAGPGDTPSSALAWAGLLLLLGRRRGASFLLAMTAVVLLTGCEDRVAASQSICARHSDCLGGQLCLEGLCTAAASCDAGVECCVLEECRGGLCLPLPTDDCVQSGCAGDQVCTDEGYCIHRPCADESVCKNDGRCIAGHCVNLVPCEGQCGPAEACFVHRDECRPAPSSCAVDCPEGQVRVVLDPSGFDGPHCPAEAARCECVGALRLRFTGAGTEASMGLVARAPVFAVYEANFGDLLYVEDPTGETPRITFVDGVPPDAPVDADPAGPRGGVSGPGPDRGRTPAMAVAPDGTVHIVYRDADARALRYVRRGADGTWTAPMVLDDQGDVGHHPRIRLGVAGRPHVVHSIANTVDGLSGVRYLVASSSRPNPGDFRSTAVSVRRRVADPPAGPEASADPGRACLHVTNTGRVLVAFYRADQRWLYLARGSIDGFEVSPLSRALRLADGADRGGRYADFETHDVGVFCGIAGSEDALQVVFTDHRTWSLLAYRGPFDGQGELEIVDDGGRGTRRRVGADLRVHLDPGARLIAVYQDATDNDVRFTIRQADGWTDAEALATHGAIGFSNSLVVLAEEIVVGTVELRTVTGGRLSPRLHVLRIPLPALPQP